MKLSADFKGISKRLPRISKVQKFIIVIGLNIIVFILLFLFIINPLLDTKRQLASDYAKVKQDLDRMVDIKNNMEKYRKEYAQMQEVLVQLLRQLPETKDIPNLLRNVSTIGTETRVKVSYFEPGVVQNKDFYGEFPFRVKFNGPYHNIGYFFDGIRRIERVVDIRSFTLNAKGAPPKIVLDGEFSAKSYVYLKEKPQSSSPAKVDQKDTKSEPAPKK